MKTKSSIFSKNSIPTGGAGKHFISRRSAGRMTKEYRDFRDQLSREKQALSFLLPELPLAISYKKEAIRRLMAQKGCRGLRVYPGINKRNELTLIFVGVDADGLNMMKQPPLNKLAKATGGTGTLIVDEGQMSPPYPAKAL